MSTQTSNDQFVPNSLLCVVPTDLTIWNWLFDSKYSPLNNRPASDVRGYSNAITKERVSYQQVKEYSTYLSTALANKYGLKEQQTVALFSPNTIWYPVAMLGTLRAGLSIVHQSSTATC